MRLSFNMEYFGECKKVIDFYLSAFDNASADVKLYREMPTAEAFGIAEQKLDLIWRSSLTIPFGKYSLLLELSDSLLAAMDKEMGFSKQIYNPVITIAHKDEEYIKTVFERLYGTGYSFESLRNGSIADRYGIQWAYEKSDDSGIFYNLSFDGFCSEVIAHYEIAFDIETTETVYYADSPCADKVSGEGGSKIYRAILAFQEGEQLHALRLSDSLEAAINNSDGYDPNALLFYRKSYNPVFVFRNNKEEYLIETFDRLSIGAKLNKSIQEEKNGLSGSLIDRYGICWNFYPREGEDSEGPGSL